MHRTYIAWCPFQRAPALSYYDRALCSGHMRGALCVQIRRSTSFMQLDEMCAQIWLHAHASQDMSRRFTQRGQTRPGAVCLWVTLTAVASGCPERRTRTSQLRVQ